MSIRSTFEPMSKSAYLWHDSQKRSAVKLAKYVPVEDVAWMYGVGHTTIYKWRKRWPHLVDPACEDASS